MGHSSSNGMSMGDRLAKFGKYSGHCGENIAYGSDTAKKVVIDLLIDDGVASRGHRKNLFNLNFEVCGVAVGYHQAYDTMAVQNFATSSRGNGESGPTPQPQKQRQPAPQRQ